MFIRAERGGDWDLHLFCQMEELPYRMPPHEYTRFVQEGVFTVWKGHEFWFGTCSEMVIEQNLMLSMKVKGFLISGRGFSDSVLTQLILSGPGYQKLCDALEKQFGISNTSSEQHVELPDSRRSRDDRNIQKFLNWFSAHPPLQTSLVLQSISTGVVADENINCDKATTIR
ncbi:hypothetical protein PR048_028369 [Dryococelus australis]|uniref:Uncharacterized protein n=1 Tax=Dryococelus australis TaxID=614101 RepID=A0ABQ9GJ49_9NEOP|nr:hypothetical protein PR048_028369 [Dryococelus australis]